MREGDYGLRLRIITYTPADGENDEWYGAHTLEFSASEDMFGNPYGFKIYT
jgi:hypothetical protein